jgi:predicted small secreted protein
MNSAKKIMVVCVVLAAVGMLSACGTVKGFGRDVSTVGSGIQKAAR